MRFIFRVNKDCRQSGEDELLRQGPKPDRSARGYVQQVKLA
jgi:hypothetical protein